MNRARPRRKQATASPGRVKPGDTESWAAERGGRGSAAAPEPSSPGGPPGRVAAQRGLSFSILWAGSHPPCGGPGRLTCAPAGLYGLREVLRACPHRSSPDTRAASPGDVSGLPSECRARYLPWRGVSSPTLSRVPGQKGLLCTCPPSSESRSPPSGCCPVSVSRWGGRALRTGG